jgi:hypothetical protein
MFVKRTKRHGSLLWLVAKSNIRLGHTAVWSKSMLILGMHGKTVPRALPCCGSPNRTLLDSVHDRGYYALTLLTSRGFLDHIAVWSRSLLIRGMHGKTVPRALPCCGNPNRTLLDSAHDRSYYALTLLTSRGFLDHTAVWIKSLLIRGMHGKTAPRALPCCGSANRTLLYSVHDRGYCSLTLLTSRGFLDHIAVWSKSLLTRIMHGKTVPRALPCCGSPNRTLLDSSHDRGYYARSSKGPPNSPEATPAVYVDARIQLQGTRARALMGPVRLVPLSSHVAREQTTAGS